jgi:hypothetical protein
MSRLPSWLIVAAVGILVALAAADAIRPHGERPQQSGPTVRGPELSGVLLVAGPDCSVTALRLPALEEMQAPRQIDCGGVTWSPDGTLNATCKEGFTDVALTGGPSLLHVRGCGAAWRVDGSVGVIRDGELVVARRRGQPRIFFSQGQLAQALEGQAPAGERFELAEVAWLSLTNFAAIVQGPKPWERAIGFLSPGGGTVVPELGQHISSLRASPLGNVAFAHNQLGREFVMITPAGREVPLPRIANARAIAWSPDERWVALATRTTTFIARTGTRQVVLRIPVGGESLDWLR